MKERNEDKTQRKEPCVRCAACRATAVVTVPYSLRTIRVSVSLLPSYSHFSSRTGCRLFPTHADRTWWLGFSCYSSSPLLSTVRFPLLFVSFSLHLYLFSSLYRLLRRWTLRCRVEANGARVEKRENISFSFFHSSWSIEESQQWLGWAG